MQILPDSGDTILILLSDYSAQTSFSFVKEDFMLATHPDPTADHVLNTWARA
jgi:hypothetical protein